MKSRMHFSFFSFSLLQSGRKVILTILGICCPGISWQVAINLRKQTLLPYNGPETMITEK